MKKTRTKNTTIRQDWVAGKKATSTNVAIGQDLVTRRKTAFTLAEMLITLAIFGVVAAITIPNLLQEYKKQQTVTLLKKQYAVLKNALQKGEADNGSVINYDLKNSSRDEMSRFMNTYFIPYLQIETDCTYANPTSKCTSIKRKQITDKGLVWFDPLYYDYSTVKLKDGSLLSVLRDSGAYLVLLDINGDMPPNRLGKDYFYLEITTKETNAFHRKGGPGFFPRGAGHNRNDLKTIQEGCKPGTIGSSGGLCAALIMLDGKIAKDYPW